MTVVYFGIIWDKRSWIDICLTLNYLCVRALVYYNKFGHITSEHYPEHHWPILARGILSYDDFSRIWRFFSFKRFFLLQPSWLSSRTITPSDSQDRSRLESLAYLLHYHGQGLVWRAMDNNPTIIWNTCIMYVSELNPTHPRIPTYFKNQVHIKIIQTLQHTHLLICKSS